MIQGFGKDVRNDDDDDDDDDGDDDMKAAVPHIGWNGLCVKKKHAFMDSFDTEAEAVYFVHSFRASPS